MSKRDELIHDLQKLAVAEKAAGNHEVRIVTNDAYGTNKASEHIAIERDHEVHDWAIRIGCSEHDLREAINVVGNSADEVRRYLSYRKR